MGRNSNGDGANSKKIRRLTNSSLTRGLNELAKADADLSLIYKELGRPPLWPRDPGFPALLYIILEQQISLAAAAAAFNRLLAVASPLTPERFLELDDAELKAAAFSRQKIVYGRILAEAVASGTLDLDSLHHKDDASVRSELMKIKGIGHWTAEIYLLRSLVRPDAWPSGDLALQIAVQEIKRLPHRPGPAELDQIALRWKPWRAVAARLLWNYYLHKPSRNTLFALPG
jgi:DNA-3-methyladenine glycosylase II